VVDVDLGKNCLSNLRDDIVSNRSHEGMPTYLLSSNKTKRDIDEEEPDEGNNGKKRLKSGNDNKDKFKDFGEMVKIAKQTRNGYYQVPNISLFLLGKLLDLHRLLT
jgi:hypothetical protein